MFKIIYTLLIDYYNNRYILIYIINYNIRFKGILKNRKLQLNIDNNILREFRRDCVPF